MVTRRGSHAVAEREAALNATLEGGRWLDAFNGFYHAAAMGPTDDHAVTSRMDDARAHVLRFLTWAETFRCARLIRYATSGTVSGSEWIAGPGARGGSRPRQFVVTRRWVGGRVSSECILNQVRPYA